MSESNKVEAVRPRGFPDRDAADIAASEAMMAKIREVYALYGFEPVETPFVEYTAALGKFLPDQDRPNEGVFSFQDDDEQWLSLRYDLTAPLARYVAEHYERLPKPYRSYRAGWVFRNEKPGPGRFRQFMQFDADTVGASSPAADAEICMMAADCLEALGVKRGDYVVKVNNRKVLDGVMEAIGLGGDENAGRRLTVLRAIDKLDRLGFEGVRALLGEGRRDESGDCTKGAGLTMEQLHPVLTYLGFMFPPGTVDARGIINFQQFDNANDAVLADLERAVGSSEIGKQGVQELRQIAELACAAGYPEDRIKIDRSVVRGLEYYTGPVFEAELTFPIPGDDGKPVRFGSVGGGGRYDGLVARFRPEPVPATGFSIGVSRLLSALKLINSPIVSQAQKPGPVVVLAMERERLADYQKLTKTLRDARIPAELYLGEGKMNAQLKYADRRGSLCAVIQGSNERDAPGGRQVVVRDLALGAELAKANKERADYLEMRARAQVAVPEAEMVERVRAILERGGAPLLRVTLYVYLCYGRSPSAERELRYAVESLRAETPGAEIAIYADRPEAFADLGALAVDARPLMREAAAHAYRHRLKPLALADAIRRFGRPCVLLDLDSFVRPGFSARVEEALKRGAAMNAFVRADAYPDLKTFEADLPHLGRYRLDHARAAMLNSGLLAVRPEHLPLIEDALALIDAIWAAPFRRHDIEQFAIAETLRLGGAPIALIDDVFVHYYMRWSRRYMRRRLRRRRAGETIPFSKGRVRAFKTYWTLRLAMRKARLSWGALWRKT